MFLLYRQSLQDIVALTYKCTVKTVKFLLHMQQGHFLTVWPVSRHDASHSPFLLLFPEKVQG